MAAPSITDITGVRRALLRWHDAHGMQAPWRASGDPYQCMVAAVMAQQTQMSRVLPAYGRFIAAFPRVEALAAASPAEVIRVWAGMGYNQRAVRLHRAARRIARDGWPQDASGLAELDGVGPFTAAIIASFGFGQPAACVDTNVRRVLGRLAGEPDISATRLQSLADTAMAARHPARWNQAVMDYGAHVCLPRPHCEECVVARWCRSRDVLSVRRLRKARPTVPSAAACLREGAGRIAAEAYATYEVPAAKQPFTRSDRYFRGRIIDALRGLPPGAAISLTALRRQIANGSDPAPTATQVRAWLRALAGEGLVTLSANGTRASLPSTLSPS